jgi:V8-like Glu-specific endopeptidase
VIYGDDNRLDYYEVEQPEIKQLADATVALVYAHQVKEVADNLDIKSLQTGKYGEEQGLCKDEPYYSQPTAAFCSGFLVSEDTIVTAGHCVLNQDSCDSINFVFGFRMADATKAETDIPKNQIYKCAELVRQELTEGQDYAVVRLDRKVEGVRPLKIARGNLMSVGQPIFVVGHPAGLPTKVAAGANVRSWGDKEKFFVANLDTYGGNSGSAVFNAETREVEGILVRGEQDFAYDEPNDCMRSNLCPSGACRGEDSTNIRLVQDLIPEQN